MVAGAIRCASSAFGGTIAESRSTAHDFVLVYQQLLRSTDRRRVDALPRGRAYSFHNASQRGPFLSLRRIHWSVFVLVFGRSVCRIESLGEGRLLGANPDRLFSNALAALIIVPLIVTWATTGILALRTAQLSHYLEAGILFFGLLLVGYVVLYEFRAGVHLALLFLPLPFLIWAAVRFGALGASAAISIIGFLAIWNASHGHGPFSGETPEQNALSIQIFLIVLAIPLLFLATVMEE